MPKDLPCKPDGKIEQPGCLLGSRYSVSDVVYCFGHAIGEIGHELVSWMGPVVKDQGNLELHSESKWKIMSSRAAPSSTFNL
jgi:hypothetical protein